MLDKFDFESITEADLTELIDAQVPEGLRVEYKRETYGSSDADKKELLKDVSSLANTAGGHIIVGVSESDGIAESLHPISTDSLDAEILRIEQIARSGIEPPIAGIHIRAIPLSAGGHTLVCRIPKSWGGPHRVIARGHNRFYMRNSAGVFEPSVNELRSLFAQSPSLIQRARTFRNDRIEEVCSGNELRPLAGGGRLFIHVVPTASMEGGIAVDLDAVQANHQDFWPLGASVFNPRFNYFGFICERGGSENYGYVQVFRNGCLEATKAAILETDEKGPLLRGIAIERLIFENTPKYVAGLHSAGAPLPYLVFVTFESVFGVRYLTGVRSFGDTTELMPFDTMKLPEGFLDTNASRLNVHKSMKPAFDALWNAFGHPSSRLFNENGEWVGTVN